MSVNKKIVTKAMKMAAKAKAEAESKAQQAAWAAEAAAEKAVREAAKKELLDQFLPHCPQCDEQRVSAEQAGRPHQYVSYQFWRPGVSIQGSWSPDRPIPNWEEMFAAKQQAKVDLAAAAEAQRLAELATLKVVKEVDAAAEAAAWANHEKMNRGGVGPMCGD